MATTLFSIIALATTASIIQRISGFGFGIFIMMFFPYLLPTLGESITLCGLLAGSTSLLIACCYWKWIQWKIIGLILLLNLPSAYFSIHFMAELGSSEMRMLFGGGLIAIALYLLLTEDRQKCLSMSKITPIIIGGISGITGGMLAIPGPPIVLYAVSSIPNKREYVATLQALFCILNIFYTAFRIKVGFMGENTLLYWMFGLVGCALGTWIGAKIFERISFPFLKKIIYGMMIISGTLMFC